MAQATDTAAWVSLKDAAERLGVTTMSIRRYISAGTLPAYRVGPRNVRIKVSDLDAMFTRIPTGQAS